MLLTSGQEETLKSGYSFRIRFVPMLTIDRMTHASSPTCEVDAVGWDAWPTGFTVVVQHR